MKDYIAEQVSKHCGVTIQEMRSESRKNNFVKARHLAFYFIRKYTNSSLNDAGRFLDRDHATCLHGYNSVVNQLTSYWQFRKEIEPLELRIKNAVPVDIAEPDDVWGENDYFYN